MNRGASPRRGSHRRTRPDPHPADEQAPARARPARYLRQMERDAVPQSVFTPVRRATTFEETVERLGSAIRAGILPAGSRLPTERDLAGQLGISRSTLRHALNTLVQSGHLVSVRGRSGRTFVSDRPPVAERHGELLGADARGVLDMRVAIETGAIMLACERAEAGDLDRLDELTEGTEEVGHFGAY